MTIYYVSNGLDFAEDFFSLSAAKKAMRENNAKCWKTKVYSNGDSVPCGEITLKGSNKTFIANSPRNMKQANY